MTLTDNTAAPRDLPIAELLRQHITQLPDASRSRRKELTDSILIEMYPHFHNWAPQLCRVHGDVFGGHREDMIGVIAERIMSKLNEITAEKPHLNVTNWYSYLYATARYAAGAYFQSPAVTSASGMTTAMRRQRHVAATRAKLRTSLGREPSNQEIIDAANADMLTRRSNAAKQGMLVTAEDLHQLQPSLDIDDHAGGLVDNDEDPILAPVEGRDLVEFIINECGGVSEELGQASYIWIGRMYEEPPFLGAAQDVAAELHVTAARASRLITQARETAQTVVKTRFGIQFPSV